VREAREPNHTNAAQYVPSCVSASLMRRSL
jgi:hypothetical protein